MQLDTNIQPPQASTSSKGTCDGNVIRTYIIHFHQCINFKSFIWEPVFFIPRYHGCP
uniref:Uncharacterized protein n=1 Tax=Arundo donax TaxID=35708 RepID=A0A0A9FQ25_ARUDO